VLALFQPVSRKRFLSGWRGSASLLILCALLGAWEERSHGLRKQAAGQTIDTLQCSESASRWQKMGRMSHSICAITR
jgi:hypothetical protein